MKKYKIDPAIDYRKRKELYQIAVGEIGVLTVEPYKSEILPYWCFKTPEEARKSAAKIYSLFVGYLRRGDFPGADMARKFLQMGYTRSRRYANHSSGVKYRPDGSIAPIDHDEKKKKSADIFYRVWQKAKKNKEYISAAARHRELQKN